MRIQQSAVAMESSYASVRAEREQLKVSVTPPSPPPAKPPVEDDEPHHDFKTWLLKLVVEIFSGTHIDEPELENDAPETTQPREPVVDLHYERVRYEAERADFHAQGVVTTADGRQIALDVKVGMQREHYERFALDASNKKAQDPLILNFDNATTTLGGRRISFDLDLDGTTDSLTLPAQGSAFLAIDRNHNGQIDDGSELFGPDTGNGFEELAATTTTATAGSTRTTPPSPTRACGTEPASRSRLPRRASARSTSTAPPRRSRSARATPPRPATCAAPASG
jgi:hypothetical protein